MIFILFLFFISSLLYNIKFLVGLSLQNVIENYLKYLLKCKFEFDFQIKLKLEFFLINCMNNRKERKIFI